MTISAPDLLAVERMITMRLPTASHEQERVEQTRRLVRVTAELTRTLSTYSRHALVHCQGSAGTTDLGEDTARLTPSIVRGTAGLRATPVARRPDHHASQQSAPAPM